jgi:hypothetical protein
MNALATKSLPAMSRQRGSFPGNRELRDFIEEKTGEYFAAELLLKLSSSALFRHATRKDDLVRRFMGYLDEAQVVTPSEKHFPLWWFDKGCDAQFLIREIDEEGSLVPGLVVLGHVNRISDTRGDQVARWHSVICLPFKKQKQRPSPGKIVRRWLIFSEKHGGRPEYFYRPSLAGLYGHSNSHHALEGSAEKMDRLCRRALDLIDVE